MKNFRFNEELLKGGYLFLADSDGHAKYILIGKNNSENKNVVTDSYILDFSDINLYLNIQRKLNDRKYLLVYHEPIFKRYKVMIADIELLKLNPFLGKLLSRDKIAAVEVQGILSILNTKLRQEKWYNYEIEHTLTEDIQTLILAKTDKKGKN